MTLPRQPLALAHFEHVNRYWDKVHHTWVAKILPGEYYVTKSKSEVIATTLGSCVSACIRDKELGIGGMNHFMLPQRGEFNTVGHWADFATRYGSYAMEHLINDILKHGGSRENLEVKLTGGGKIMAKMTDIGTRNIQFAHDYIDTEQLELVIQDVGDIYPRKVMYYPSTGRLRVKKLKVQHNDMLMKREQAYQNELGLQPDSGEVELF